MTSSAQAQPSVIFGAPPIAQSDFPVAASELANDLLDLAIQDAVEVDWAPDHQDRLIPRLQANVNLGHAVVDHLGSQFGTQMVAAQPIGTVDPGAIVQQFSRIDPGTVFRDCAECPEMVVIPGGSFTMGSPDSEPDRLDVEGPQRTVTVSAFALGRYEVTFAEWDACVAGGGCTHRPDDWRWGRGDRPVVDVSWEDAQEYVLWLSATTGQDYRLPSEAEWEYAARAGTTTARYWGEEIGVENANCFGCGSRWDGEQTAPVGSFSPSGFGLYDMLGNVWELTQDCWNDSYLDAPGDSRPREAGQCYLRVLRGGSWGDSPAIVRAAARGGSLAWFRYADRGFRVVRTGF